MKKIAFFGGTGGLGSKTIKYLQENFDYGSTWIKMYEYKT